MQEFIGHCSACGEAIYCENGFLNGVVQEDGTLVCFDCLETEESPS